MSDRGLKVLVAYESMYGHTHRVANAIGKGLAHLGSVNVCPVGQASTDDVLSSDVVIAGGPTHVHGLSRESTRSAAIADGESNDVIDLDDSASGPGLRSWLESLPDVSGIYCAAFDTRVQKPVLLVGSAARGVLKRLKRRGFVALADAESFFVEGTVGPLVEGEEVRAQQWATIVSNELIRVQRASS